MKAQPALSGALTTDAGAPTETLGHRPGAVAGKLEVLALPMPPGQRPRAITSQRVRGGRRAALRCWGAGPAALDKKGHRLGIAASGELAAW